MYFYILGVMILLCDQVFETDALLKQSSVLLQKKKLDYMFSGNTLHFIVFCSSSLYLFGEMQNYS